MKIRWNRTGVRFRITPSELDALARDEAVSEVLMLPGGGHWSASLRVDDTAATRLTLDAAGELRLFLAPADRDRLAAPETEGVYFTIETTNAPPLRYYVEKDFPCAHPRAAEAREPAGETFPAPCAQGTTKKEYGTHE